MINTLRTFNHSSDPTPRVSASLAFCHAFSKSIMEGSSRILCSHGYHRIADFATAFSCTSSSNTSQGKTVHIYNGLDYTADKIQVLFQGEPVEISSVYLSNGVVIDGCSDLQLYRQVDFDITHNKGVGKKHWIATRLSDLQVKDIIQICRRVSRGNCTKIMNDAYSQGKKLSALCYPNKNKVNEVIKKVTTSKTEVTEAQGEIETEIDNINVPINYSSNSQIKWLSGLLEACIAFTSANEKVLVLNSYYITFLDKVFLLLLSLSCNPVIQTSDAYYTLTITGKDIDYLYKLGLFLNVDYIYLDEFDFLKYHNPDGSCQNVFVTDIVKNHRFGHVWYTENTKLNLIMHNIKVALGKL